MAKLNNIEQLITNEINNDEELYTKKGRPERVNREIYNKLFIPIRGRGDESFNIANLNSYTKKLDNTRIKTKEEYLKEVNDAPINLLMGTTGYMPPEMYLGVDDKQRHIDKNSFDHPIARNRTLHSNSEHSECELSHLNLNELISKMYLKYMYNQEQLHSCRHLIKQRIIQNEKINASSAKHLKQIDNDLYLLYIAKRKSYNPMALGLKKRKSMKINSSKIKKNKSKKIKY